MMDHPDLYDDDGHIIEYDDELKEYKYTTKIYYGGVEGNEIFIGKPIIYKKNGATEIKKQMYQVKNNALNLIDCNIINYIF